MRGIISRFISRKVAGELSEITQYYDSVTQLKPLPHDNLSLFNNLICQKKSVHTQAEVAQGRDIYLYNGNFNHGIDIQNELVDLKNNLNSLSRVISVLYNPYIKLLYQFGNILNIRTGQIPDTFLTEQELKGLCKISGYEIISIRPCVYLPIGIPLISSFINFILPAIPLLRKTSLVSFGILRPLIPPKTNPSISIIIPARNEKGNIEDAIKRLPAFGNVNIEVLYVEGHSQDGTWDEILRVQSKYHDSVSIIALRQSGKGKCDAVRLGFESAKNDLLMILDADLTMPPEELTRFYDAFVKGHGDFINGSRLIYPMEKKAMRFLNFSGNKFFAKSLSYLLDQYISDSLCGTKIVLKKDYKRMIAWRKNFGDFDPFGDFELLFPAAQLGLQIVDIPIKYKDRVYGETQIRRFHHGLILLRMTLIALFRIKAGKNV